MHITCITCTSKCRGIISSSETKINKKYNHGCDNLTQLPREKLSGFKTVSMHANRLFFPRFFSPFRQMFNPKPRCWSKQTDNCVVRHPALPSLFLALSLAPTSHTYTTLSLAPMNTAQRNTQCFARLTPCKRVTCDWQLPDIRLKMPWEKQALSNVVLVFSLAPSVSPSVFALSLTSHLTRHLARGRKMQSETRGK